ncbi:MAG: GNAT family N-acetyltransferase [Oscillospiraceae bacterium]|jgi:ribosomal protein S18 acetylase RimI-like enzyme|nr:GNAT family N-acetyltransferase [Oscillospiraceae bacterium]
MLIRWVAPEDVPRLVPLWRMAFGDSESYVYFFLERALPIGRGLLLEEEGKIASMLFLLPGSLLAQDMTASASYVFAVATAPSFRGRGFAAALTRRAAETARAEGQAALCLFPGEAGLYEYYARLGFQTAFARQERRIFREGGETPYLKTNLRWDPADAAARRADRWAARGCFAWDARMLDFMRQSQTFGRGRVRCAEEGYVFYSTQGGKLLVEECCAPPEATEWLLQKALMTSGCEEGIAYLAAGSPICAKPGGMCLPLDDRAAQWMAKTERLAYLGLTLE